MKNKHPLLQSNLFKIVGFQFLLFLLFLIVFFRFFLSNLTALLIVSFFFLTSLLVVLFFSVTISGDIRAVENEIDNLSRGEFDTDTQLSKDQDFANLHEKLLQLSETIQNNQEELENQHNRLNGILTYMTDGIIATDRRGMVVLANQAAIDFLAISIDHATSSNLTNLLGISDKITFNDLLQAEPSIVINSENAVGEFVSIKVKFTVFRRASGAISGIVAVLHDVTEQERMERERRLFVSNVSHELRTPLTAIKAYLEALDTGALQDTDLATNFVKTSLDETNHMNRMISELLVLSRLDQHRLVLEKEMVNIVAFLAHQLGRFEQILTAAEHTNHTSLSIVHEFPLHPVWIEIDPDKMGQIIDNIVSNAIKYSPDGGKITISLETNDHQVIISIKDEGMGIPAADLPKIFDRFYRVDKARSRDVGGTGLGLAIAYDIVKLHKGSIWAKSDGQHGSEFTIALPYTPLDFSDDEDNEEWE